MSKDSAIRVLLADDHSIVLDGLRRIIEDCDDMEVAAEASDGAEALRLAVDDPPDVAVIDISMPGYDGLEVVEELLSRYPKLPIIILTMHEDEQYVYRAVEAGALGYITKRAASEQLVAAIRKVYSGRRFLPEDIAEALALRLVKGARRGSPLDSLSTRELQVLKRLAQGQTNQEIAAAYYLSVKTVDTYRLRILKKLHLRNNAELSRFAMQHRVIE